MGGIGEFPANQFGTGTRVMPLNMCGGDRRQDPNVPISGPWPLKEGTQRGSLWELGGIEIGQLVSSFSELGA